MNNNKIQEGIEKDIKRLFKDDPEEMQKQLKNFYLKMLKKNLESEEEDGSNK